MAADASAFDGRPCNRARFAGGVQRIILSLDRAFEMRAAFDGDGLVHDVTFDPRGCGQADFQPAYLADYPAIDDHVVGQAFALDRCAFTDGQKMRADVAF